MNILDMFRLDGKIALVTGCRRGIGRGMAIALAQAGADIIGVSSSMEAESSEIEQAIKAEGRQFTPYACDFSNRSEVLEFITKVKQNHPRVDILVNNVGTNIRIPFVDYEDADWDNIMEVNLNSSVILAREFGKLMLERGSGKLIFTASMLSFQGGYHASAYAATKGAIGQLTKSLSNEWAAQGVQVNAIAPGYIDTDLTIALQQDAVRNPAILARIPAGRWGKPEDLMGATVFLASSASDYVTGTIMIVDGGWQGR